MPGTTGFQAFPLDDVSYLIDGKLSIQGQDVLMASGQTSGISPDHRHPPGTVVVKKTGDGKYYLATDSANVDAQTAASVDSLETNPGGGGWDGTVNITGHWGSVAVALSGDDTDAAAVAAINAALAAQDPEYGAAVATEEGVGIRITNRDVGSGTWLKAVHATVSTMFGASGQDDNGEDGDVRVLADYAELKDIEAQDQDYLVPALLRGHFRTSALSSLTAEAQAVLERRGSRFE